MKIAVVDDLAHERSEIIKLVRDYISARLYLNNIAPQFTEFESGESFLACFEPRTYDLVLLDIYMATLTGIETAEQLLLLDKQCKVIFFTSSTDHILEGYGVRALSYVLKPVTEHRNSLYKALDYFMDLLDIDSNGINICTYSGEQFVLLRNIIYIESSVRNLFYHFVSDAVKINGTYAEHANTLLKDERFLEPYRNITVNMDFIDKPVGNDFILKTGEKIPISRRKKAEVLEKYTHYFINRRGY